MMKKNSSRERREEEERKFFIFFYFCKVSEMEVAMLEYSRIEALDKVCA